MEKRLSAKEKRQVRKEKQVQIRASKSLVDIAAKQDDPMVNLKAFKMFSRNGLSLTMNCKRATDVDSVDADWAFHLAKDNMKTLYDKSELKWKDREKQEELNDETAWYLIARDGENLPVAFVNFRFDLDDDVEVLYCYEVQLETRVRRKGLGKFMMQILELLAFQSHMKKVVLTVFKHNVVAMGFFIKCLSYEIDETSPSLFEDNEDCTYEILSKKIKQRQ